jgi:hypothetical protein
MRRCLQQCRTVEGSVANSTDQQIFSGDQSLHDLFTRHARQVLDDSDLDEDAKQVILVALNCPCCGAGGMNYTAKIDRKKSKPIL